MRLKNVLQIFVVTVFVMILTSCNSSSEKEAEAQTVQNNSPNQNSTPGNTSYQTVENGFRLTESSLKSVIPESLLGIGKSGEATFEEARSGSGLYSAVHQTYYDTNENSANYLDVYDYGDDQEYINDMMDGMQYTNFDFSKTHQNDQGWYITETFDARGDKITSRTLTVRNPRFIIELRSVPGNVPEPPSFESMMSAFGDANLLELLELEIPQGDVETAQVSDTRNDLTCDDILPVERIRSFCGIDGIEVNVTSFEQQKNCNRQYAHPDNLGGLTFIVTQYSDNSTALSAVQTKLDDEDLDSESVSDTGDAASMVTVDMDLFLSVAYNNYLIELRSGEGMGPVETASVCMDKEKLRTLANDVIEQLP